MLMAFKLTWYAVDEVLHLSLKNVISPEEMREINEQTTEMLEGAGRKLSLIIDVSELIASYATVDSLRMTQRYRDHHKLDAIIVIANNKLNRLITLLAFNLCRAHFMQFDNREKAHTYMSQRGMVRAAASNNSTPLNTSDDY
jgi:hypothetical protein